MYTKVQVAFCIGLKFVTCTSPLFKWQLVQDFVQVATCANINLDVTYTPQ